ncbi:MAG: ATP-binding protein [Methanomicrobiaceae archaeon]|nr:ATP-binding protein [Methanomicrobiaceae archaeon]
MSNLDIVIPAKPDKIEKLASEVDKILSQNNFSKEIIFNVQLSLEEVIVNIINHGYRGKDGLIGIRLEASLQNVSIEISDSAPAFNPLLIPKPDITSDIDERSIGGLGIYLVREVMDEVSYQYKNNKNILTLIKDK